MPCDTVQTSSIEFKGENTPLLVQALGSLGSYKATYRGGRLVSAALDGIRIFFEDGRIIVPRGSEGLIDRIKQAYSRQIVIAAAKRFGFQLKRTGENRFLALRRR